ncbi:MAG TPA: DUF4093 domain-containing protein [Oscillospiraceae bacterium]|nr:DUF4093 domain-containing protein [Oscillospiraceae bacterium]HRW56340.1 DUF4093 domain-containing protein [Oscillospiraceae bacterium]
MEPSQKPFKLKETLIVEGKYDKIRLSELVEGNILALDGFRIYNDKERLAMIRALAARTGIAVLTDSDPAGFQLRGYLASAIPVDQIRQIYIPDIPGKEKRKVHAGKAGLLGVEGMDTETLRRAFEAAGVGTDSGEERPAPLSKACLYELGLSGGKGSHLLREKICERYCLPKRLSANALGEVLAVLTTEEELRGAAEELRAASK